MIRIERVDEPLDFDVKVRQPGLAYLNGLAAGEKPKWTGHSYWCKAKKDMLDAYGGICAYACCEISPRSSAEIDHFHPKSRYYKEAYEWENFRLCSSNINKKKKDAQSILDPFKVRNRTFGIELATGRMIRIKHYDAKYESLCDSTISVLGLDAEDYRKMRSDILDDYLRGDITIPKLKKSNPFVYSEVKRLQVKPPMEGDSVTIEMLRAEI